MWGTLRFFLDVINCNYYKVEYVLLILQSYGDNAQAFWNFILFCVCDQTVRSYILSRYYLNGCCNTSISSNNQDNTQESIERPDIQHKDDEKRPILKNPRFSKLHCQVAKEQKQYELLTCFPFRKIFLSDTHAYVNINEKLRDIGT
ncbi:Hypothetical predicted protein [Mytilus galloprovincialis]|uniref:Uncharacterized protein n=1 Tax=Mytilus galloprovincialis TaxID=29158 RepID=A0A8B6HDU8_MYTGA|nr:Hypothetical predicted protein [Mytilus galloprovincialis]